MRSQPSQDLAESRLRRVKDVGRRGERPLGEQGIEHPQVPEAEIYLHSEQAYLKCH